ncbi:hypothetical protein CS022_22695 [Veronia nyctiphanis]|uniref:Bro-N domain-containing protein n=1 Tax=Veronia nyctiphanis TaxID=1278244 RepID=A0A4Q0YJ38_9GAMM|nr:RhuM family protein [Veronia nyctiphanis]RXJ70676.1 hypothetical protein CS022_22695 [Veronia nyctiphanis]
MKEIIKYKSKYSESDVIVLDGVPWVSLIDTAKIYKTDITEVSSSLKSIFLDDELKRSENIKVPEDRTDIEQHFLSVDAVISVGYRIDSREATKFRKWSTDIIKKYLSDGFVVNEDLLRNDPQKLNEIAAKIREIRASEQSIYAAVRECFKVASSDYVPNAQEVKSFYALLQDKFHHAVTKMTASKLILDRANHLEPNMGLTSSKADFVSRSDAAIGKNYLSENEIYRMHLLSEQFLIYAELNSLSEKKLTMKGLHKKLDDIIVLNGFDVFDGYQDFVKDQAIEHAKKEYELYIEIKKLEYLGVDVDLESFYAGDYDHLKEETKKITLQKLRKNLSVEKV